MNTTGMASVSSIQIGYMSMIHTIIATWLRFHVHGGTAVVIVNGGPVVIRVMMSEERGYGALIQARVLVPWMCLMLGKYMICYKPL